MRVLIIEDDYLIRESLNTLLSDNGYACDTAKDGLDGLHCATEYPVDLAIIDIGLPKKSGVEIIQAVREKDLKYPILILTARDSWQEKVNGLEAGADDYLVKPFHNEELLARLNALLRRSSGHASPILTFGDISLDTAAQLVTVNNVQLNLTAYEYRVLECLMLNAGKVLSKTMLTEHVYDEDAEHDSNVMEVFVGRLRKKLNRGKGLHVIETIRGQGYRFITENV